ncbi:MAG: hypothetical protein ACI9J3_000580 [Parvicellaceae bacterium]
MRKQPTIWTVVFHFFVLFFAVDVLQSATNHGNFNILAVILLIAAFGTFIRNKITRVFCHVFLVIPGLIGCYYFSKLALSPIFPDTVEVTDFGYVLKENFKGAGYIGFFFIYIPTMVAIILNWKKWFSIKEYLIFAVLLVLIIVFTAFDFAPTVWLNDWIDLNCEPKPIIIN